MKNFVKPEVTAVTFEAFALPQDETQFSGDSD